MRRLLAASLIAVGVIAWSTAPASAADRIGGYDVWLTVRPDGTLDVHERIAYDFGAEQRHGIYRDVPTTVRYDDTYDRRMPLTVDAVTLDAPSSSPSASSNVPWTLETLGNGDTRIKVGDPDTTISGRHTYDLWYHVDGTLNAFSDHVELYWNAIGTEWDASIADPTVHVTAPGKVLQVACFSGSYGSSLPCDRATSKGTQATFHESDLFPYQAFTVVVAMPLDAVSPTPQPILVERLTFANAWGATPVRTTAAGILAVVLIGSVSFLLWRVGRDRRFRGSQVDQVMGGTQGDEWVPPFDEDTEAPVEFAPPEGIRPGQVGALMEDHVLTRDVSVTIVDLAVRGYLRIEEIPKHGLFGKPDWRFVRLREGDADLVSYERALLDGLFQEGNDVTLSSLRQHFAERLVKVDGAIYDDLVTQGWFRERPDKVRLRWRALAALAVTASIGLTVLLIARWRAGIVGLPFVVASIVFFVGAKRAPARTAKGTAMLRRVRGFRRVVVTAEANMAKWAEHERVFTRYLPYAMVFGCTEEWVRAFSVLGEQPAAELSTWYVSPRPFAFDAFGHAMDGFVVSAAGTMAATPAGSGSSGLGGGGFSGGGGGGGGGGSW